jgi:hypothetical protein
MIRSRAAASAVPDILARQPVMRAFTSAVSTSPGAAPARCAGEEREERVSGAGGARQPGGLVDQLPGLDEQDGLEQ